MKFVQLILERLLQLLLYQMSDFKAGPIMHHRYRDPDPAEGTYTALPKGPIPREGREGPISNWEWEGKEEGRGETKRE